jgi:hypothetical protein
MVFGFHFDYPVPPAGIAYERCRTGEEGGVNELTPAEFHGLLLARMCRNSRLIRIIKTRKEMGVAFFEKSGRRIRADSRPLLLVLRGI